MEKQEKGSFRAPRQEDFQAAAFDMITLRSAPPLMLSLSAVFLVTGNAVVALVASTITTYFHALWARLFEAT